MVCCYCVWSPLPHDGSNSFNGKYRVNTRKIGQGLIILGILGILLSLLVDFFPGAKAGIQAAQILGIEISIFILLVGSWILFSGMDAGFDTAKYLHALIGQVKGSQTITWAGAGFLVTYILFFLFPVFLNPTHRMNYPRDYLPDLIPIGNDLIVTTDLIKGWFSAGQSPYLIEFYPPLTYAFFAPLLLIDNYSVLFELFTLFTFVCYCLLTLVIPVKILGTKQLPIILLLFVTGLFSYGLQFEFERGQHNIFTFLLCIISIYIFHYHRKHRLIAYLLFSISVQLKLYPLIFIVMLVDNWKDWKGNFLRFLGLGIFNFILLFAMGKQMFLDFSRSVSAQIAAPSWNSDLNHSIQSFVSGLAENEAGAITPIIQNNTELLGLLILAAFAAALIFAIFVNISKREPGLDSNMLLVCTIGALIIPISYDYKLPLLVMPLAIFLSTFAEEKASHDGIIQKLLIFGMSLAYSSTLISPIYKPDYLKNNFPILFLILIFSILLTFIRFRKSRSMPE